MRLGDVRVVVSPMLPISPSIGEQARRFVRHGYADVLEWLGESVGPEPEAPTHAMQAGDVLFVSAEYMETLRQKARPASG